MALVALLLALPRPVAAQIVAAAAEDAVRRAIADSVRARMGARADVQVNCQFVRLTSPAPQKLVAIPEPSARLARDARFTLFEERPPRRRAVAGYAVARVYVVIEHLRSTRPLGRGTVLAADDLTARAAEIGPLAIERLPVLADAVGGRTLREMAADQVLTHAVLAVPPLVNTGQVVRVRAREGIVDVQCEAVAAQSGLRGDTIRVVNQESHRALKVRVTGRGEVEVIQ